MQRDHGDILASSLLKLVAFLLALGLVIFEVVAVGVNFVQLDGIAGDAIRAGASVPERERTEARVERAILGALESRPDAALASFTMERDALEITVTRTANVLVLDRLGPLADLAENSLTKRAEFR